MLSCSTNITLNVIFKIYGITRTLLKNKISYSKTYINLFIYMTISISYWQLQLRLIGNHRVK